MDRTRVRSTFGAKRSGDRNHRGIDLFAPRGTPVRAMGTGLVLRAATDQALGGNIVLVLGAPAALHYYAHLDTIDSDIGVGSLVRTGTPLGTVGNTGNARTTRPHLHYEIRPVVKGFQAVDPAEHLR